MPFKYATDKERKQARKEVCKRYYEKKKATDPTFLKRVCDSVKRSQKKRIEKDPSVRQLLNARTLAHYHNNVKTDPNRLDRKRDTAMFAQQQLREKLYETKKRLQQHLGGKCIGCGLTDHRLLDFDHLDPATKTMNISQNYNKPWDILIAEANKCQLLCPNCHRLKTLEQKGYDPRTRDFKNPRKGKLRPAPKV